MLGNEWAPGDRALPGAHRVATSEIDAWTKAEGRDVAVFAQYPECEPQDRRRVVVLCHGLGGDHRGYARLGSRLASNGYVVLHPQFLDALSLVSVNYGHESGDGDGSADVRLQETLRSMLFDPEHWVSRVARVNAVIDSLAGQAHLPVGLEGEGVIVAGHSFGAYTAQLVLGTQLFGTGLDQRSFRNPAVAGGVLLSPQGSGDRGLTDHSWSAVDLPLLVVTATNDLGPHGEGLAWRRQPFDAAPARLKHLAVARGSDHLLGGTPDQADPTGPAGPGTQVRDAIAALAVAFVNRVHGDRDAGAWLASGPFPELFDHEHREAPPTE